MSDANKAYEEYKEKAGGYISRLWHPIVGLSVLPQVSKEQAKVQLVHYILDRTSKLITPELKSIYESGKVKEWGSLTDMAPKLLFYSIVLQLHLFDKDSQRIVCKRHLSEWYDGEDLGDRFGWGSVSIQCLNLQISAMNGVLSDFAREHKSFIPARLWPHAGHFTEAVTLLARAVQYPHSKFDEWLDNNRHIFEC